jgi:hypothetical protein
MAKATISNRLRGGATVTAALMDRIREGREARMRRRVLCRELAQYTTADDLNDLEAAVARYDDEQTSDIRRILATQRSLAA